MADRLPSGGWLIDLGGYPPDGAAGAQRVAQLCHSGLPNEFPSPRVPRAVAGQRPPAQLTSFVGRRAELGQLHRLVSEHRLVTLTGTGGVGKTRLAVQLAGELADAFPDGVWWADLAAVTDPRRVGLRVARALGLPDQPGRSATETLTRFIGDQRLLVVLDNCEHLLDGCADVVVALLGSCPDVRVVATSREPTGVAGEMTWLTPSLSLADEAIELFAQRARLVRPDFTVDEANAAAVSQICHRLDGVPLALELAAARVRALSLDEVVAGLVHRFRLLTGGSGGAVPRQQTLRASVDWSHALLSVAEQVLFRRLAVFSGGFDLAAAHAVAGADDSPRHQVLDELALLVDKSLVIADSSGCQTRYGLLETVRDYGLEQLGESGEADAMRSRHRDYYTAMASDLYSPSTAARSQPIARLEAEIAQFSGRIRLEPGEPGHRTGGRAGIGSGAAVVSGPGAGEAELV